MLTNDCLQQPDGISYSIASFEGFLACVPRQTHCELSCQNFMEAPDRNVRDGNWTVLHGRSSARLLLNHNSLPPAEGRWWITCKQPHIEMDCQFLTPHPFQVVKGPAIRVRSPVALIALLTSLVVMGAIRPQTIGPFG